MLKNHHKVQQWWGYGSSETCSHGLGVRQLSVGNVIFYLIDKWYQHPASVFVEQRSGFVCLATDQG